MNTAPLPLRLPALRVMVAAPRGFCAGVDRAVTIVERAIERFGAPVYVRHEIVHNAHVVDALKLKGAVFVEELDEVPDGVPVVFSAHGVPKSVPVAAAARGLNYLDATCPLVSKVHRQAERLVAQGRHILFIGHAGHPEVIGTFGQVPPGTMTLVETLADAQAVTLADPDNVGFLTQTTLSVDDTAAIVACLQAPLPRDLRTEGRGYLLCDVEPSGGGEGHRSACAISSSSSARSIRPTRSACARSPSGRGRRAYLIQRAADLDWRWFDGVETVGVTAGASAPEVLVGELMALLGTRFATSTEEVTSAVEEVVFKLPRGLDG